jgi:hypothetical protein
MKPNTIYSKSGKGVQEASGKTSLLKRADRAVLSAIDGRATLAEVAQKVGKSFDAPFEQLIQQLDKDGFVREVSSGGGAAAQVSSGSRPAATKPAPAPAAKPPPARSGGEDLDFTTILPAMKPGQTAPKPAASAPKPASPAPDVQQRAKEQESALNKARQEAEARGQAERDRVRLEVEAKARAEAEAKIRAETEQKLREEAEAKAKAEAEAKTKAARDAAARMAAEAKAKAEAAAQAKIEAERKLREEAERKAKEEAEKARREAEELRLKLEEERKAREAEERKRREEEEARRKEEEERRAREEAERKARDEAERQRREEEERKRREEEDRRRKEEEERRMREEIDAKAREAAEAARREEEDRRIREKEEQVRRVREEEDVHARKAREEEETQAALRAIEEEAARARKAMDETKARQPTLQAAPKPEREPEPPPSKGGGGSLDALMADLDSFSQREEQERETREAAERKAKDEKKRRVQEDSERRARELAAHEQREAEKHRRQEEEERRAQEEAERRVREAEEQRRLEAEERKRRARELAAKPVQITSVEKEAPAAAPTDDIGVTDKDLDMDDVRRDEALVTKESRKAQREREREQRQREKEARERAKAAAKEEEEVVTYSRPRRKIKWGRPVAITLFVLLVAGVGVLHVMPLPMEEYEQAASAALGRPVRISSGRLSLVSGVRLNLEGVSIGDSVKIAHLHAYPAIGSLFDEKKRLNRVELEGVTIGQRALGETLFAKIKGDNFSVGRIVVKQLKLDGPVPLPVFEADAALGPDGALRTVTLRGPEQLTAKLTPANGSVELDITASSLAIPFAPELTLDSFAMRGNATSQGMNVLSWGGGLLGGALSGTANVRWAGNWQVDGVMTARGINAAVFAPALVSEGKAEGTGRFSMSGADPAKLSNALRMEGSFTVTKGVLGSFDLTRVLQTSGRQYAGRTQFTELLGQGTYDRGAVALRNITMTAGALSAGANADIAPSGALSGRIVADVRIAGQSQRATLILGGTVREPQVRN